MDQNRIDFFECFYSLLRDYPDKVILSEGPSETDITISELNVRSAKVYRYLKEKHIGKEDMVNIYLPRGTNALIALMGIWKAGAAAVFIDDNQPKDRVAFIQKDCGAALVINEEAWDEIEKIEPLEGNVPIDPHAAAFAIYTSGTTGNPKGVLHEYGRIPLTYLSCHWEGRSVCTKDDIFPVYFPLSFVPTVMITIMSWFTGMELLIVPSEVIENPAEFLDYFIKYKATIAFFTPSFYRIFTPGGPYLKTVIMASEPANGIWSNPDELRVLNAYCCSESANGITVALLDKPNEIAPIGRPQYDAGIYILREDGTPAEQGEAGELCYDAPFTRGYINLPEQNNKSFINGIFHSGDLARQMEDGQYQLIGRLSDLVKINGKRIEPGGVEEAIRHLSGLEEVAVRGFKDGAGEFLAAYYVSDVDIDTAELRKGLEEKIPYYMIPSYFIRIDCLPRNKNGKLDRKALPIPVAEDYLVDYVAPSTEIEKILCDSIQKILNIKRVGINDDFFLMGGDSYTAIEMLVESELPLLNIIDIYDGRTVANIAELYEKRIALVSEKPAEINAEAQKCSFPLGVEQLYIMNYEKYMPDTTMYNISALLRIGGNDVENRGMNTGISADNSENNRKEAENLAAAVRQAILNHPSLLTEFYDDNGTVMQHFVPEKMPDIVVEDISDEELERIKDTLVLPFGDILNKLLWRARIFRTPSGNYLFFDVHHLIFDGMSCSIFVRDIQKALSGEKLSTDYYYYLLSEREAVKNKASYAEAKKYYEDHYLGRQWDHNLHHDFESDENKAAAITMALPFDDIYFKTVERELGLTKNALFITAGLLALAAINDSRRVMVTWIYKGRNTAEGTTSTGLLMCTLPLAIDITDEMTVEDLINDVRYQIEMAIRYSVYPYVSKEYSAPVTDDSICIILQDDMSDIFYNSDYPMEQIDIDNGNRASQTSLDVEVLNAEDETILYLDYAASLYKKETIERYGNLMQTLIRELRTKAPVTVAKLLQNLQL